MHKEGSTHTISPEASEMPALTGSGVDDAAYSRNAWRENSLRPKPIPARLRMRPAGEAARAEDTRLPGSACASGKFHACRRGSRRTRG